jgi:hypothetical protein
MSKRATPQAISALLRREGFDKSVVTRKARHYSQHTAGYRVTAFLGEVRVNWWPDNHDRDSSLAVNVQKQIETGNEMRARYAKVIAAAGYLAVERSHTLVVRAQEDPQ